MSRTARARRGSALVLALFVMALAVLLVAGLQWNQFVLSRTVENRQNEAQMRLLLGGALDWSRAILRDQPHPNYDALSDPWAQPLAPTRLADLGETSPLASRATLAGGIEDAQGRFNLRNLLAADGTIVAPQLAALDRLAGSTGAPAGTAALIAGAVRSSYAPEAPNAETPRERPLAPVFVRDLVAVPGIDPQAALRLSAFLTVLDQGGTPVNFNTATPEVMSATLPDLSLGDARALVAERDQAYFRDPADLQNRLHGRAGSDALSGVAVRSQYFLVRGTVTLDSASLGMEAMVKRSAMGAQGAMEVLWVRER